MSFKAASKLSGLSVGIYIFLFSLVAIWTDRNLDFWFTQFRGVETNIPWWLSLLVSIVGNAVVVAANVLAELARFAI